MEALFALAGIDSWSNQTLNVFEVGRCTDRYTTLQTDSPVAVAFP